MRVSYVGFYYDKANRTTDSVDVGSNAARILLLSWQACAGSLYSIGTGDSSILLLCKP